jgi:hypothetical protein
VLKENMMASEQAKGSGMIEVRLESPEQFLHSLDAFPARHSSIEPEVADYVIDCAADQPVDANLEIVLHLRDYEPSQEKEAAIARIFHAHFQARADLEMKRKRQSFSDGRQNLMIGVFAWSLCMLTLWVLNSFGGEASLWRFVRESIVIIGWVLVWKPAEIFLYDWKPFEKRKKLFLRLAQAPVKVRATPWPDSSLFASRSQVL